nr:MAG TPA: hypothetical protein [Caudoviricetes sp.]
MRLKISEIYPRQKNQLPTSIRRKTHQKLWQQNQSCVLLRHPPW